MFSADYDLAVVAFSVLVAILASCTALSLVQRVVPASITSIASTALATTRQGPLTSGAFVMGAGIWSTHFIGMLAFRMPLQAGYDFWIILLALAMVILVSALALRLAGTGRRSLWRLGAGALFMGLGISAMHYIGMASIRLSPAIVYSPQLVAASVAIAVSASGAAFWLAFHVSGDARQRRLLLAMATGAMSLAIVGTHFIGMAAAAFPMESVSLAYKDGLGQAALAIMVIAATLSILAAAMVTAMVDRARESDVRSMSALHASLQARDTLLHHLPGAVCRYRNDRAWTMEYASEGIRELTGHGPDAFCGKAGITYASLVHEEDRNRIYNDMQEAIYRREPFRLVYRLMTRERLKWVSAQGEGLYAEDGSLLALQAFIVDITEHKEREDTGRTALAAMTATLESITEGILVVSLDHTIAATNQRFIDILHLPDAVAASLDYESLTTHMLSIVVDAPAYLKSRERLLNHPDREFHDQILLRDGRLLERHSRPRLVDGRITGRVICLLDITEQAALEQRHMSRIESGRLDIDSRCFDLPALLEDVCLRMRVQADIKGIVLDSTFALDLPRHVRGDPLRLAQILLNLIRNGIRFTSHGKVSMRVSARDAGARTELRFEVEDTGIGMDTREMRSLFQPFHRGDTALTRKPDGSGLGLAISKSLVEQMGGSIEVESKLGQGSRFWVVLLVEKEASDVHPARAADSRRASHDSHAAQAGIRLLPPDLKGASILVVEDCPINRMIAGEYLEKTGASVLMAADGQEALDVLAREKVDCVLMDMQMPEMNGLEATQRIRADGRLAGLPVIAMTASAGAEDCTQCEAAGMNDFLSKPLVPEVFYGVLSRTLSTVCTWERIAEQPYPEQGFVKMEAFQAAGTPVHEEVQGPAINLKVLCDMVQADPEKLRHFAYRFTASAQDNLLDIQRAMEQKNWSALAGLGHRCKSSARAVGALQLAAFCEALEKMPAALAEKDAPVVVARLQPMLDAIHREVEEWFHATQEN
jgi:PAS domain S-box-containing protein